MLDQHLAHDCQVYPAFTVPGRFLDSLNIVCVTETTDISQDIGINGSIITSTFVGGDNSTSAGNSSSVPNLLPRQFSSTSKSCLVQSYDWTGSDIIRPDCTEQSNSNISQCIDPTDVVPENERIANLYPNVLLCSKCFLNLFYLRLASPYLADADHSDYLVEQWFDILDVCNVASSMPDLLVRDLPFYPESQNGVGNATDGFSDPEPLTGNATYNATCQDRTIAFANLTAPTINFSTQDPCDVFADILQTGAGDVERIFGNPTCIPDFNTTEIPAVCAPQPCKVVPMKANTTW